MSHSTIAHVYGIPNCSTVKNVREWLAAAGVEYQFHDFKKAGVPKDGLADWIQALGWESLLNRKGSTWRELDASQQAAAHDAASASALMTSHPSVIKRPVVRWPDGAITVGFYAAQFEARQAPRNG